MNVTAIGHSGAVGGRAVCIQKQILEVLEAGNLEDGTQRDTGFDYTAKMVSQGGICLLYTSDAADE